MHDQIMQLSTAYVESKWSGALRGRSLSQVAGGPVDIEWAILQRSRSAAVVCKYRIIVSSQVEPEEVHNAV